MKKIILAIALILTFSGCSQMALDAGSKQMTDYSLQNDVTYICYDWIDKKECPEQLMQLDIDILPYIFGTSRFCFGFSEITPNPECMNCYYHDLF